MVWGLFKVGLGSNYDWCRDYLVLVCGLLEVDFGFIQGWFMFYFGLCGLFKSVLAFILVVFRIV